MFTDTSSFFECAADEEAIGRRRLQGEGADSGPQAPIAVAKGYSLRVALPPQFQGDGLQAILAAASERGAEVTAGVALLIGLSQYLDMPLQDLWGGINVVQVISHLPLNNVNFPYIAQ